MKEGEKDSGMDAGTETMSGVDYSNAQNLAEGNELFPRYTTIGQIISWIHHYRPDAI